MIIKSHSLVPGLERGLAVLDLLSRFPSGLLANELAAQLDAPHNSTGRILQVLVAHGFVRRDDLTRRYTLTRKLLALSSPATGETTLMEAALPLMKAVRDKLDESVFLTTVHDCYGVILEVLPSRSPVRLVVDPGIRFDLHNTAPGKVALAFKEGCRTPAFLHSLKLARTTAHTITTLPVLEREIALVQRLGYGTDRSEKAEGISCVAAPIFDRHGSEIAELVITGLVGRMPDAELPRFGKAAIDAAREISKRICNGLQFNPALMGTAKELKPTA